MYGLYPMLIGIARNATLFWIASLIGGATWAITNGGLVNRLMERVPEDDRSSHMALHNSVLNLGILFGSIAGPILVSWMGIRNALIADAGLRLLGGILLVFWG